MRPAAWEPSSQITVAESRHSPDAASDDGQYAGIGRFSQATGSIVPHALEASGTAVAR
jgi:hypothetical protein